MHIFLYHTLFLGLNAAHVNDSNPFVTYFVPIQVFYVFCKNVGWRNLLVVKAIAKQIAIVSSHQFGL